ncbi:MAG TPA: hypothetical protein VF099_05280 [Ktedonobacterales bacterium]
MTDELHTITLTLEIESTALTVLQQQADQQGLTLDQLAARYIGRAAAQAETHAGLIRAANAFNGLVERNQPQQQRRALERKASAERSQVPEDTASAANTGKRSQDDLPENVRPSVLLTEIQPAR